MLLVLVYKCGFEYDKACEYMSLNTSYGAEWHLRRTKTPTSHTGPTEAGSQNYYVYMESSDMKEGDNAVLTLNNPQHKLGKERTCRYIDAQEKNELTTINNVLRHSASITCCLWLISINRAC